MTNPCNCAKFKNTYQFNYVPYAQQLNRNYNSDPIGDLRTFEECDALREGPCFRCCDEIFEFKTPKRDFVGEYIECYNRCIRLD
ncbi:MAG: hypothetical protein Harvfovirus2_43 [Harvfovirus sp.]|uniref:Uncharacterized protein n=1 Tax=Harvfovirus sp. TaxID=2487768 RepID=A0A3G5A3V6_9VIRU|nr:MAG: hypothetical protein Harvfovirus2_43 [Harvfovirus sp.]